MRRKKITIILEYDYNEGQIAPNEQIVARIRSKIMLGVDKAHEHVESITVEDY